MTDSNVKELLIWEYPEGHWNMRSWTDTDSFCDDLDAWKEDRPQLYWSTDTTRKWYSNRHPDQKRLEPLAFEECFYSVPLKDVPFEAATLALLMIT